MAPHEGISMAGGVRQPVFNLPGTILAVLPALIAVHLLRLYGLSDSEDSYFLRAFAFVPGQFTFAFDPDAVARELERRGVKPNSTPGFPPAIWSSPWPPA